MITPTLQRYDKKGKVLVAKQTYYVEDVTFDAMYDFYEINIQIHNTHQYKLSINQIWLYLIKGVNTHVLIGLYLFSK